MALIGMSNGISLSEEELKPIMKDVLGMVDRMSGTIDHLRVFSRDKQDEPPVSFNVNEVVHSSLQILGTQLKGRGIEVALDLAEELPTIVGHPHQIEQVLLNLIGNARDALDVRDSEKRVGVETRGEDGVIVVEVVDNGQGMDEETQRQIFEPFFTTKEAEQGTGLGLSISYAIVQNHKGQIGCESQVGG